MARHGPSVQGEAYRWRAIGGRWSPWKEVGELRFWPDGKYEIDGRVFDSTYELEVRREVPTTEVVRVRPQTEGVRHERSRNGHRYTGSVRR